MKITLAGTELKRVATISRRKVLDIRHLRLINLAACYSFSLSLHTHTQIHALGQILMRHSLQPEVWPSQTFSSFFSRNGWHFPAAWARVASRHQFFISPVIVFYFTPLIVGDMFIFYDVTGHSAICSLFSFPVLHLMAAITPHRLTIANMRGHQNVIHSESGRLLICRLYDLVTLNKRANTRTLERCSGAGD